MSEEDGPSDDVVQMFQQYKQTKDPAIKARILQAVPMASLQKEGPEAVTAYQNLVHETRQELDAAFPPDKRRLFSKAPLEWTDHPLDTAGILGAHMVSDPIEYVSNAAQPYVDKAVNAVGSMSDAAHGVLEPWKEEDANNWISEEATPYVNLAKDAAGLGLGAIEAPFAAGSQLTHRLLQGVGAQDRPPSKSGSSMTPEDFQAAHTAASMALGIVNPLLGAAAWTAPAVAGLVDTAYNKGGWAAAEQAVERPLSNIILPAGAAMALGQPLFRRGATPAPEVVTESANSSGLETLRKQAIQDVSSNFDAQDPRYIQVKEAIQAAKTPEEIQAVISQAQPTSNHPLESRPHPLEIQRPPKPFQATPPEPAPLPPEWRQQQQPQQPPSWDADQVDHRTIFGTPDQGVDVAEKRFVDLTRSLLDEPEGPMKDLLMRERAKLQQQLINEPRAADTGQPQGAATPNLPVPVDQKAPLPRLDPKIADDVIQRELAARGLKAVPDEGIGRVPDPAPVEGGVDRRTAFQGEPAAEPLRINDRRSQPTLDETVPQQRESPVIQAPARGTGRASDLQMQFTPEEQQPGDEARDARSGVPEDRELASKQLSSSRQPGDQGNELSLSDIFSEPSQPAKRRLLRDAQVDADVPDPRDTDIVKRRLFDRRLEADLESGKVQRAGVSKKAWAKLLDMSRDQTGSVDLEMALKILASPVTAAIGISKAAATGLSEVLKSGLSKTNDLDYERDPELISPTTPGKGQMEDARKQLELSVQKRGGKPLNVDSMDDAAVAKAQSNEHQHYLDSTNRPDILNHSVQVRAPQVLKRGIDAYSAFVDPVSKYNVMRQISQGLSSLIQGSVTQGQKVRDYVMNGFEWMDKADHEAVARTADGSATAEDTARIEKHGLQEVVDRIEHVSRLALTDPKVQMTGVVADRPYITRAGLKGWLNDVAKDAEIKDVSFRRQRSLDVERRQDDVPAEFFRDVDVGKLMQHYGSQVFDAKYSKPWFDTFVDRFTGGKSLEHPDPDSYAAKYSGSMKIVGDLVKQSIGNRTYTSDAVIRNTIRAATDLPAARVIGQAVGKIPFAGEKLVDIVKSIRDMDKPVSAANATLKGTANFLATGFNPGSSVRHLSGDLPTVVAQLAFNPRSSLKMLGAAGDFLRDPNFAEKMYDEGIWDRGFTMDKMTQTVGNESGLSQAKDKLYQAGGAALYGADAVCKAINYRVTELTALDKGFTPEQAHRSGVEMVRRVQNNWTAANTSPLLMDPAFRAGMMFTRAPNRVINAVAIEPILDALHGDFASAAKVPGALMMMYGTSRLMGYNILSSVIHSHSSERENILEKIAPVAIPLAEAKRMVDVASGNGTGDWRDVPQAGLRRIFRTSEQGEPARNLFSLQETKGNLWDDIKAAAGTTRPGQAYRKFLSK